MGRGSWVLPIFAAFLLMACGDDGAGTGQSPSPGPSGEAVCFFDLADDSTAATVVYGGETDDFLGDRYSTAAGDFNGDGYADLLLGAPLADGEDNGRVNSGEAYIIFGSGSPPAAIDLGEGEADVVIYGEGRQNNFGLSVAAADVNCDGLDDVIAGARFASPEERMQAGRTYVIFGNEEIPSAIDLADGEQDVTIDGRDDNDFSGIVVAAADVSGDGVGDVLIGAIGAAGPDNDRARAGEVYVVPGASGMPSMVDLAETDAFFVAYGAFLGDSLPSYISAGDVDGDGTNELLIGAHKGENGDVDRNEAGLAYVVRVPENGGALDLAREDAMVTVIGRAPLDHLGHFTAFADLNDDGFDDLIIGARDADDAEQNSNVGEVYVVFGAEEMPATLDLALDEPSLTITGAGVGDSLGFTVADGDVNGDGVADLVSGAPLSGGCGDERDKAGEAIVLFGGDEIGGTVDLRSETPDLTLYGRDSGDEAGFSLALADVNADGRDDLIIGALMAAGPEDDRPKAGEVYVILSP